MSVTDDAIAQIKAMIVSGRFQPGTRLPKEEDLAGELGLSRNSLREAVRALTAMKILVVRQGDGSYVSSLEPGLLMETLTFASDVSHGMSALQLLQTRVLLEPQITALAASAITDEGVERLRGLLERSESADGAAEFVALDVEFHRQIVATVGNPVLEVLAQALSTPTQRVRILRRNRVGRAIETVHAEHRAILDALAARDPALAAASAMVHVAAVERWLRSTLSETGLEQ